MKPQHGGSFRRYTGNTSQARHDGLPTDMQMTVWRLAGQFTCQCAAPDPEVIGAWCSYECRRCRKPYFGETRIAEELITNVITEIEGGRA